MLARHGGVPFLTAERLYATIASLVPRSGSERPAVVICTDRPQLLRTSPWALRLRLEYSVWTVPDFEPLFRHLAPASAGECAPYELAWAEKLLLAKAWRFISTEASIFDHHILALRQQAAREGELLDLTLYCLHTARVGSLFTKARDFLVDLPAHISRLTMPPVFDAAATAKLARSIHQVRERGPYSDAEQPCGDAERVMVLHGDGAQASRVLRLGNVVPPTLGQAATGCCRCCGANPECTAWAAYAPASDTSSASASYRCLNSTHPDAIDDLMQATRHNGAVSVGLTAPPRAKWASRALACGAATWPMSPLSQAPLRTKPSDPEVEPRPLAGAARGLPSHRRPPCDSVACWQRMLRQRADAWGLVTIAATNVGQVHFWWNLKCSLTAARVTNDVLIGFDEDACAAAEALAGTYCVYPRWVFASQLSQSERLQDVSYGSLAFVRLQRLKTQPVLEALRLGYHVLYTDVDTYWFADPRLWLIGRAALEADWFDSDRQYTRCAHDPNPRAASATRRGIDCLTTPPSQRARGVDGGNSSTALDLLVQSDFVPWNARRCRSGRDCARSFRCGRAGVCAPEANAGFYFMRAGEASERLMRRLQRIYQSPGTPSTMTEQPAFNQVLVTSGMRIRWQLLPVQLFPNGWAFRGRKVRPQAGGTPFIAHHNWIAGSANKRRVMREWATWALAHENGTDLPKCRGDHAAEATEKASSSSRRRKAANMATHGQKHGARTRHDLAGRAQ